MLILLDHREHMADETTEYAHILVDLFFFCDETCPLFEEQLSKPVSPLAVGIQGRVYH